MSPNDWSKIQFAFDNPKEVRSLEQAVTLMETPYKAIRADSLSFYGKNVGCLYLSM